MSATFRDEWHTLIAETVSPCFDPNFHFVIVDLWDGQESEPITKSDTLHL